MSTRTARLAPTVVRADPPRAAAAAAVVAEGIDYGPLAVRLGYALRRAQLAVFQDIIVSFARHDIQPAQYSVLTIIQHNPGLTQSRVGDALGIKKTNLVAMIDTLERRGLVRRLAMPGDRRSYAMALTGEGEALLVELHRISSEHERRLMAALGEDYARLFAPLALLAGLVGADPAAA